jgi:DNA-binding response OmpR family regulator
MGRRVLVIEDEPNIVAAISFILERDGWDVRCHDQGADAMEVVRATAPDLLILDVMLPGRNGYDILKALRAEPGTAELPVLMLTARGQTADRAMAETYGASGFIAKPFSNAEVLASVRDLAGA